MADITGGIAKAGRAVSGFFGKLFSRSPKPQPGFPVHLSGSTAGQATAQTATQAGGVTVNILPPTAGEATKKAGWFSNWGWGKTTATAAGATVLAANHVNNRLTDEPEPSYLDTAASWVRKIITGKDKGNGQSGQSDPWKQIMDMFGPGSLIGAGGAGVAGALIGQLTGLGAAPLGVIGALAGGLLGQPVMDKMKLAPGPKPPPGSVTTGSGGTAPAPDITQTQTPSERPVPVVQNLPNMRGQGITGGAESQVAVSQPTPIVTNPEAGLTA